MSNELAPMPGRLAALARWLLLGSLVGVLCGSASALFLWLLERATTFRVQHEQLVFALPLAGLGIGWIYQRFGASIKAGNSLIIDTIHDDGPELPLRMAPMVLLGTVLTHLFGGSAGREGTAVQMGASLTDFFAQRLQVATRTRRLLLAAGAAAGFGASFLVPPKYTATSLFLPPQSQQGGAAAALAGAAGRQEHHQRERHRGMPPGLIAVARSSRPGRARYRHARPWRWRLGGCPFQGRTRTPPDYSGDRVRCDRVGAYGGCGGAG